MSIEVIYANPIYFESFRQALDEVARERMHLEMVEAPPLESVSAFQQQLIENDLPTYYAIDSGKVVGWIDISRSNNPRLSHRGGLGMGLLHGYRGRGIGSHLMYRALDHSRRIGLEKVELTVYAKNFSAIALYKKFGFTDIGIVRSYRKIDGLSLDALEMELFL